MAKADAFDFGFDDLDEYDFGLDVTPSPADFSRVEGFEIEPDPDEVPLDPDDIVYVEPQPGPQEMFLTTPADIAIYGGSAGGGKTFALLMEPLRHHKNEKFGAVCFRRTSKQVRNQGGLWDESLKLYSPLGAEPRTGSLDWTFPEGMRIGFGHLEYDVDVHNWHGSQIPLIMFDELTQFTRYQFMYMLSRNRSDSGVPGYIRATCNPDADSWVRQFIDWWIDAEGWAIPERAGKLRWMLVVEDEVHWADTKEKLIDKFGLEMGQFAMSVTFIPATVYDNKKLLEKDPSYLVKLKALPKVERMRLLGDTRGGNWNIRHTAGSMFRREWFPIVEAIPAGFISSIRFWDRASTPVNPSNPDPDWTRGLRLFRYPDNTFVVGDLRSTRASPGDVETLIKNVASMDGYACMIKSQCDPGSAGQTEAMHFTRMLVGYNVKTETMHKNKVARAKPVSAQVQAGNIKVLRATWNNEFFTELENFPSPDGRGHDDIVDVLSGAFNELSVGLSILDFMQ
jgi:predicted phage terminase large subunit-like protein